MPRRSQIPISAITLMQLKDLDFKYSSTDLEYHKMFFKGKKGDTLASITVDYDSIPKDKLEVILGNEPSEDIDQIRAEYESEIKALKDELAKTSEALSNLRKINNAANDKVFATDSKLSALETDNENLKNEIQKLIEENNDKDRRIAELETLNSETESTVNEVVENDSEYEDGYATNEFIFIHGTIQTVNHLCENALKTTIPEDVPSNVIITFLNGDEDSPDFLRDQDGKIICVSWLNDYNLDNLAFTYVNKEPVVMGEGEVDSTTEV